MASHISSSQESFKKFLPTLFSDTELRDELIARSVKLKKLDKKSKDELLHIYMHHFMSLPQRHFPNNHHGQLINKMIEKERSKSRKHIEFNNSKMQFGFADNKRTLLNRQSSSSKQSNDSPSCDRLKPPISKSDLTGKKISLSRSSSSSDPCLEKVVIRNHSKGTSEMSREAHDQANKSKVELKRSLSDSEKTKDESSSPKKVRQRIAWP